MIGNGTTHAAAGDIEELRELIVEKQDKLTDHQLGAIQCVLENDYKGDKGDPGEAGRSAYEVALANGFDGTEAQWLASLKGADGADGADGFGVGTAIGAGLTYDMATETLAVDPETVAMRADVYTKGEADEATRAQIGGREIADVHHQRTSRYVMPHKGYRLYFVTPDSFDLYFVFPDMTGITNGKMMTFEAVFDFRERQPQLTFYHYPEANEEPRQPAAVRWIDGAPDLSAPRRHLLAFRWLNGEWLGAKQGEW